MNIPNYKIDLVIKEKEGKNIIMVGIAGRNMTQFKDMWSCGLV